MEVKHGQYEPATEVLHDYLRRFPKVGTRTLARKALTENPLMFKDFDAVRQKLRYWRGANGKACRKNLATDEFIRPADEARAKADNPFGLPDSAADNWKPIDFPVKKGRGLILADLHIPYHDIEAVTLAIQWGQNNGYTDFVLLLGDVVDSYDLSRFQRNPNQRRYRQELDDVKLFLDAIERQFPKAVKIWKRGNHEWRLERYLRVKAAELFDLADFIWQEYMNIKGRGITVVEHDIPMKVGKLNIIHGHELQGTSNAVNPARGAYMKAHECVLEGHWHRTSQHAETSLNRRLDTAWSIGCLCCLWPEYARLNKWNHGVCGLEVDGKDFEVDNRRIFQGMVR